MDPKDIILGAMGKSYGKRGLKVSKPSDSLCVGHMQKANHNLIVMTDLSKLGHEDWVVIAAYYAMYQSALSLLAKIGLESKEHATSVSVLEYFFGEHMGKAMISEFNDMWERKDKLHAVTIGDRYLDSMWKIKRDREAVQYGIELAYNETEIVMKKSREFVAKIRLVENELDEKLIASIIKQIMALKKISAS